MADDTTAAPVPVKPGYKTSEFWLSTLAVIVGAVLASGIADKSPVMKIAGMASVLLSAMGYTVVRGGVKKAAMLLAICTLALGMGACCSVDRTILKDEVATETKLMAELSAYVAADPAKSQATKDAEQLDIQAHLKRFQSLNATK